MTMSIPMRLACVVGLSLLALAVVSRVDARLTADDFVPLATQGFLEAVDGPHPEGSLRNSYAWSMRWWHDKLYVGTQKDVVCFGAELLAPMMLPLADCPPPGMFTAEQRADVWVYTPGGADGSQGTWQRVFQSPLLVESVPALLPDGGGPILGGDGTPLLQDGDLPALLASVATLVPNAGAPLANIDVSQIPQDVGYRNMVLCEAGGTERLYLGTFGFGGRVIYTADGVTFLPASILGLNPLNDLGYRAMACWKGRLWIAPTGALMITGTPPDVTVSFSLDNAFRPILLVNDDPSNRASPWRQVVDTATDPQLGDAGNQGIYSMAVFADALYLGVTNSTSGFELWRADGTRCQEPPGPCVLTWEKRIDNGGGRPLAADGRADNARIFDFDVYQGYLYWGAAEAASTGKITTAELGRIAPDGSWDLIVGMPRDTAASADDPHFRCARAGDVCVPLSGLGPGFGPTPLSPGTANYIWQFEAHEGFLYAGTADLTSVQPDGAGVPGADLWRSADGIHWSLVFDNGLGNPFNIGVRTLASSPMGLFLGTSNPLNVPTPPDMALEGTPGAEVWLGIDGEE
jgi:hypothetical protein